MPPAAWAGAILVATSIPGSQVPRVGLPHVDKVVHFALYAVLGVLLARAILATVVRRARPRTMAVALAGMAGFAALDEWHQRWVPGRSADFPDWVADVAGGTVALLLAARLAPRPEHIT